MLATVIDFASRGESWTHIEITLMRVMLGFLAGAAAAATVLGALTGYSRLWRQLLDPMLQGLRAIPSIAWVPLFTLMLADRVIVLLGRPGKIRRDEHIDVARPRRRGDPRLARWRAGANGCSTI